MSEVYWLPVSYRAEFRAGTSRATRVMNVREDVPVSIEEVGRCREVISFRCAGRFDLTWKEHDGALWRPIMGRGMPNIASMAEFTELLSQLLRPGSRMSWGDYPLRTVLRHGDSDPFAAVTSLPKEAKRVVSNRAEVMEQAAGVRIVTMEGVPHIRSVAPCWSIGNLMAPANDFWSVHPCIPDSSRSKRGVACFPLDRRDEAEETCRRVHALYLERFPSDTHYVSAPVATQVEIADGYVLPSETEGNRARGWDCLREALSTLSLGDLGTPFLEAYVQLSRLDAARPEGGVTGQIEEAFSRLADLLDDESIVPTVTDAFVAGKLVAISNELLAGYSEEDVEALEGIGPSL